MYENMSPADIAAITDNGNRNNDGDGAFGGNGAWWIIVLFLFMWGRGGWGGSYGGSDSAGASGGQCCCSHRADIHEGFALNNLDSGIRAIQQGICDSTYALNNAIQSGFNATQMGMMQGFNGVERGFCNLSAQLAQCCCETQRGIDGVNFNVAKGLCDLGNVMNNNTRDILESQNNNTRAILDFLTQDKIATLTAENQNLKFAASQSAQNAYIGATIDAGVATLTRRLGADCPTPAYVVQPPTPVSFPLNGCGQVQFAQQSAGCGCGCSGGYAYQ